MQAVVGLLQNGTTAVSCLEINAEGNPPQLKGGLIINSDRNEVVLNLSFLNHDRTLINKTTVYKIDKVPLWLARKIIDLCAMKIDPKNSLQPVANMKTGQILVTITIVCIETDPDDTLETSLRNPKMFKHNRSVVDCRILRKAPANPKIKNCSYDPLEPHERMELEHHIQNKRGETWCLNDLKYWCEKHHFPVTEINVATWWQSRRSSDAVNIAMRSTNRHLQNIMCAEFRWDALTDEVSSVSNPSHRYFTDRQAPVRHPGKEKTEPKIVFGRNGKQTLDGKPRETANKTPISQHKSIKPSLTGEKAEKPRVQQPGTADKKPTQVKSVIYGSTNNRVKKPQTMEEIIDKGASMRLTILSPDEDPAREQYEELMKKLEGG